MINSKSTKQDMIEFVDTIWRLNNKLKVLREEYDDFSEVPNYLADDLLAQTIKDLSTIAQRRGISLLNNKYKDDEGDYYD